MDQLGSAPDYHFMPVGNAGNITAYWKGYNEYKDLGKIDKCPKMMGFQAEGSAPIVRGHVIENPANCYGDSNWQPSKLEISRVAR